MMDSSAVSIRRLTYTYPNDTRALEEIDLEIQKGEFVAVMGANGAGKTTLCLLLNGVIPHITGGRAKGNVRVLGLDTFEHHVYDLAQHVGMVLQDPEAQLFSSSVQSEVAFTAENLGMPRDQILEQIAWTLQTVRLEGLEERTPSQLSGGQKQRLAIASSLIVRPQVMVLDEPTSQLDPLGSQEVFSVLRTLNEELGLTIVLATHKSEPVARFADRVVVLEEGRIAAQGTPTEVFGQVELLDRIHVQVPAVTRVENALPERTSSGSLSVTLEESRLRLSSLVKEGRLHVSTEDEPSSLDDQPAALPDEGAPCIDVQEVGFSYPGTETPALDGVSFRVNTGEFIGIIGQNGAGKTTLMKAILGLLPVSAGRVSVDGEDIAGTTPAKLARRVGLVLQNPDTQLFALSATEEVAFGPRNCGLDEEEIEIRVEEALQAVGLWKQRDEYPFNFSFGDRRKISVAAVASMHPQVLMFDEPTTGQDYSGRYELADIAQRLNERGTTVIMITHDMDLIAEYTDRVVVMGHGRVLMDGPTREVFQQDALLAETFIAPPQVTQLAGALEEYGIHPGVLTTEEFCAALVTDCGSKNASKLSQAADEGGVG